MWTPPERVRHAPPEDEPPTADEAARALLYQPLTLASGLTLRERTWVPAMVPWRATEDGLVTPAVLDWYGRFADGQPGAVVVEATGIRDVPSGPLLRIGHDRFVPGLADLAGMVRKRSGLRTRVFIQIIDFLRMWRRPPRDRYLLEYLLISNGHRERLAGELSDPGWMHAPDSELRAQLVALDDAALLRVLSPREAEDLRQGARERVTDTHLPHIRDLPELLPDLFAAAARRARDAGFDGVELHYAHAYTMASFLSAVNTREDGYGGPREARARLPLEVHAAVRAEIGPRFTVGCRFLCDDIIDGGNRPGDAAYFGVAFARAGMDFLSLSTGGKFEDAKQPRVGEAAYPYTGPSGYECMPTVYSDQRGPFARNVPKQALVRRAVRETGLATPVVVAGGIGTFRQAEAILRAGDADIIGAARQSLADPDWFRKVRTGQGALVRRCQYTNYCEALDQKHKIVTCQLWDRVDLHASGVPLTPDGRRRLTAPPHDFDHPPRPTPRGHRRETMTMTASPPTFPETFNLADYYLFDRLSEGLGDKVAVRFGAERHTYAQIADRVRDLQAFLASKGVAREQRVLIVLHDTPAFVWAFFATLLHGAVVAMGNPEAPPEDLRYLLEYTRAAAVITIPRVADAMLPALRSSDTLRALILSPEVMTGGDVLEETTMLAGLGPNQASALFEAVELGNQMRREGALPPRKTRRDDIAIWLFTSGSTGKSKAAMHTHRDFAYNTEVYAKGTVGYRQDDVTVSIPRLFFGYATGTNLMFPFAVGATTALFAERPTPKNLTAAILRDRPTIVTNVPTMMGKLLDEDDARRAAGESPLDLGAVRFHLSAGEALPPALLARFTERFKTDVYDGIGSAEMFHIYCSNRPGDIKPGSLGRAVDGYTLKILASEATAPGEAELPRGETGVMWVKGDSVALGYFQDRDKSWSTFHGHWCRTGDLFRLDEEGYLWFSGRADDLLKVGGIWVAPIEVEECLMQHAAVSLAAVIGAEEEGLTKPKAFVILREEARAAAASDEERVKLATELKEHVKRCLSKHKYPRWVVFVDDVPKNDRGKVDKKALKEREARGENPAGD